MGDPLHQIYQIMKIGQIYIFKKAKHMIVINLGFLTEKQVGFYKAEDKI